GIPGNGGLVSVLPLSGSGRGVCVCRSRSRQGVLEQSWLSRDCAALLRCRECGRIRRRRDSRRLCTRPHSPPRESESLREGDGRARQVGGFHLSWPLGAVFGG